MSRTILILLVVATVLSTALSLPSKQKCKKNEEWTECGTLCPPTCCKKPQPCALICVRGCQCKSGLLRNHLGECVRPCDCNCK